LDIQAYQFLYELILVIRKQQICATMRNFVVMFDSF